MKLSDLIRMKGIASRRAVPLPQKLVYSFLKYNVFLPSAKPLLPRAMCIYVTYRCNMKCAMCQIWKEGAKRDLTAELSVAELEDILGDRLFSRLEFININGGEPNLREDLTEIAALFTRMFPRLKTISVNSNGLPFEKAVNNFRYMSEICKEKGIKFSVSISLHDTGKMYDEIAGIPEAYEKVNKTLQTLKKMQNENNFYLGANCVVTRLNIDNLERISEWSEKNDIPVNFTLGEVRERFRNLDAAGDVKLENGNVETLIKFLRKLAGEKSLANHHAFRYKCLADMIEHRKKRYVSCHYAMGGVILGAEGSLFYCKDSKAIGNSRNRSAYSIYYDPDNLRYRQLELLQEKCMSCPPNTFNRIEFEKDSLKYLKFLLGKKP
jgi:MoaA/NifB/PqqE/SkfB family radical SAM enzyme